jgi:hypothetical protein
MAHTLTEADQPGRPGLTGEAAHDEVCAWLGFHSGPTLTDDVPALAGMYLHLAGVLRAELPEFGCAGPGGAFVVEGWAGECEATRELYAPGTGLLPRALRATGVGSFEHRDLTLAGAVAADRERLTAYGLDPGRRETFADVVARVRYRPDEGPFAGRLVATAMEIACPPDRPGSGAGRRLPAGLVGALAFRRTPPGGRSALVTFECWTGEEVCERTTREVLEPAVQAAARRLGLGSVATAPARSVRADLLSIMLPGAGSFYLAAAG